MADIKATIKDDNIKVAVSQNVIRATVQNQGPQGEAGVDGHSYPAILIAASNASARDIAGADYVCDGTADDVQINAAISSFGTDGGVVILSEGTFSIANEIAITHSNQGIVGQGMGTKLVAANAADLVGVITIIGTGVINYYVKNLYINGNKANQSFGAGIYVSTPWQNGVFDPNGVFEDIYIESCKNNGFQVNANSDTRVMHLTRVRVRGCEGNGFYMPAPSTTDNIFIDCIAEVNALNGFYIGSLNSHFISCKAFYNGSATGNNHGFYILGYNNYFDACEAQDNYQSGFYSQNDGDATYGAQGNTLHNCVGDCNNQSEDPDYGCGLQLIDVQNWQIIGGIYMTRPYPDFVQRVGISLEGTTTGCVIADVTGTGNTEGLVVDSSTGRNFLRNKQNRFNATDYGVKADAKRIRSITATSASTDVYAADMYVYDADIGKYMICFTESAAGTPRRIESIVDEHTVRLDGAAGITVSGATGYLIYGTDDSAALQAVMDMASSSIDDAIDTTVGPNIPMGNGRVDVLLSSTEGQGLSIIASPITIPSGVAFDGEATLVNLITSRNAYCVEVEAWAVINRLEVESVFGNGVRCGTPTGQNQAHIVIKDIRIWHCKGSSSAPTGLAVTPSETGGALTANTRYYVVTAIDAQGGETVVSNEVSATTAGSTGSNSLTWDAFTGAASYRIYRGTTSGKQNLYYTSATNSFTDVNGSSTGARPLTPGCALRLNGYHYELGNVFIKVANVGIFHANGDDATVNFVYLIGCKTGVMFDGSGQIHYSSIFLDTCGSSGGTGSYGGVVIDNGHNISLPDIQAFAATGTSPILPQIVSIGNYLTATSLKSIDIKVGIQSNNMGALGLSIANCADVSVRMLLSNTVFSITSAHTTAVAYGSNLAGELVIEGEYSTGITPSTGSQYGNHSYALGQVHYFGHDITVPDEAYGSGWNASLEVPTKNAVYDKIEAVILAAANTALSNLASVAINTSLLPGSNDGAALGSTTLSFSDLFLASGGVINFNNGDITMTHSADQLTIGGGTLSLNGNTLDNVGTFTAATSGTIQTRTSAGNTLTFRARDVDGASYTTFMTLTANNTPTMTMSNVTSSTSFNPTTSDGGALGSTSLMWSDLFLASGGVINFNNGDVTLTHSADTLTIAGGTVAVTDLQINETAFHDAEVDNGNSSTSKTIDWSTGNCQKVTGTGNCTYTFTDPPGPCHLTLKYINDGTARTNTWDADVLWSGGTVPTHTGTNLKVDVLSFYFDGTKYYGAATLNF